MIYDIIAIIICLLFIAGFLYHITQKYYRWIKLGRKHFVLDKPVKRIWGLNQMRIGESICGVPSSFYYKNKKGNEFIKLELDYGHAICHIYFLVFDFPEQKILNSNFHNSFQLVKFYRECNGIPIDSNITQLHDINWQDIIDWLNSLQIIQIKVISKNIGGFKNIKFLSNETF